MDNSYARIKSHLVTRLLMIAFLGVIGILCVPLPNPLFKADYSTTLRSREGFILSASVSEDEQWRFSPVKGIPSKIVDAVLYAEDQYFYYHPGINPVSVGRAIYQNVLEKRIVSGASTISMQTVRMALGNKERTYWQKIKELFYTLKMELLYSKKEILLHYLNNAPYGGNIVGISSASYRYFGRNIDQLSWSESAMLAVLPNHPGNIFPGRNESTLLQKRDLLLKKLNSKQVISDEVLKLSLAEPLPDGLEQLPNLAYHLLHRTKKEGLSGNNIISTLDHRLQVRSKKILDKYSLKLSKNEIHNAASLIVDINSGNTLAYIGNSNNEGEHGQHVDIITSKRSPGSLLKPILYAASLDEQLILPQQLLPDVPVYYNGFVPKNFDKKFKGAVHADEALSASLNVPFVYLLREYGIEKFKDKLNAIGFNSLEKPANHYGLSVILGGGETSLWEISSVYASMVRSLKLYLDRPINNGYSLSDFHQNTYLSKEERIGKKLSNDGHFKVESINFMVEAMKSLKRPEELTGWQRYESSKDISWKTGTSYGFRDAWALGFDSNYLVAVWVGNADGEGRPGLTGITSAAPLMFKLFDLVKSTTLIEKFGMPVKVCSESGMLLGKNCTNHKTIDLPDYLNNTKECEYHKTIHLDQSSKFRVNSSCYEVDQITKREWFVLPPVQSWYYKKYNPSHKDLPPYLTNCSVQENQIQLIYPSQLSKVSIPLEQDGQPGQVVFEAAHVEKDAKIYWHLDELFLGYTEQEHQIGLSADTGKYLLTLIDNQGNQLKQRVEIVK